MTRNSTQQQDFQDLLNDYLEADNETRTKAKKKADILIRAEKAGFNKATFKECAKMEKMDGHKRSSHLLTLLLYVRYAGHDGQIDLFNQVSTEAMEMAVNDMTGSDSDVEPDEELDDETTDIEEFVNEADEEAEAEMSDRDEELMDAD